jgi:hypothetical protein
MIIVPPLHRPRHISARVYSGVLQFVVKFSAPHCSIQTQIAERLWNVERDHRDHSLASRPTYPVKQYKHVSVR